MKKLLIINSAARTYRSNSEETPMLPTEMNAKRVEGEKSVWERPPRPSPTHDNENLLPSPGQLDKGSEGDEGPLLPLNY